MLHDDVTGQPDWLKTAITGIGGAITGPDGRIDFGDIAKIGLSFTFAAPVAWAWAAMDGINTIKQAEKEEAMNMDPGVLEAARAAAWSNNARYSGDEAGYSYAVAAPSRGAAAMGR